MYSYLFAARKCCLQCLNLPLWDSVRCLQWSFSPYLWLFLETLERKQKRLMIVLCFFFTRLNIVAFIYFSMLEVFYTWEEVWILYIVVHFSFCVQNQKYNIINILSKYRSQDIHVNLRNHTTCGSESAAFFKKNQIFKNQSAGGEEWFS